MKTARTLLCLLAIVALARSPVGAQNVTPTPQVFVTNATTPQTIPSAFVNRVLIEGTINGKQLWFHLDTGTSGFLLGEEAAKAVGLTPSGGQVTANLDVGSLHAEAAQFYVTHYGFDDGGHHVAGIIGAPFFLSNVVTIDYGHQRVIVYPNGTFDPRQAAGTAAPISLHDGIARIHAWFGGVRATMLMDTGDEDTIVFEPFAEHVIVGTPLSAPTPVTIGIGTPTTMEDTYDTKPLSVGGLEIRGLQVFVPTEAPSFLPADKYDGILGRDVYRQFASITFDYANSQIYLDSKQ